MPIEVSAFAMQHSRSLFTASSLGGSNDPVLARPVFASQGGGESVFLGGFPGLAAGDISVIANTNLWGLDANAYFGVVDTDVLNVDFFLGYRYQELRENVLIFNSLTALDSLVIPFNDTVPGVSTVNRYDQFGTQNRFNGGQLGMRSALHFG